MPNVAENAMRDGPWIYTRIVMDRGVAEAEAGDSGVRDVEAT